ncbi:MAG: sulfatase-like hydrolase/transferase [Planctomycetes bacterium]|nr:sulfatase-like hydrolase/transferase [Planctomycetota bacterium]
MRLALVLVASLAGSLRAQTGEPPNVVLLMADDQGYGDASFQGHDRLLTPHLDAMAREGLRLTRFYASSPVCSPTRGSCLTGRHPFRYGITNANTGHLPAREVTFAEVLHVRGYATGHFGKWHLGTLTRTGKDSNRGGASNTKHYAPPWEHGFDTCFSTEAKVPTFDPLVTPPSLHGGVGKKQQAGEPYGTAYWTGANQRAAGPLTGDDSQLIMDHALAFLDQAIDAERPFLAVIWFHAPHLPVVADEAHRHPYRDEDEFTQHYFGCIAALDEQVGRLRAHLQERGVAANTLTFYASDNGPEGKAGKAPGSSGGLRGRKRDLYEGGVRVPAMITWPAMIEKGRTSDVPTSTLDYLPTIAAALGIALPEDRAYDGMSLLPLLRGNSTVETRGLHFAHGTWLARTEARYKLLGKAPRQYDADALRFEDVAWELYDLAEDPSERSDLSSEQPERLQAMAAALLRWRQSCAADARTLEGQESDR